MEVEIRSFELPPIGTQCYTVINPAKGVFAVFDAPLNAYATMERLAVETGYRLEGLYFTHGHWDHTLDGARFNMEGIPAFAHADDREFFENPESMASYSIPGLPMPAVKIQTWLEAGQSIEIAGRPVEVRHVPGHSPGSILYWFSEDKFAVSGDALFNGSIGRTDFPGCSFDQLAQSIRKQIYSLPGETIIYPGHGPETTVGVEASDNPFVAR
ncbi:MBL fold metallo-hydrolase [Puniceicoccales bacterium CK1056]|uniref:MBL fold metallo-hydrolase n=1 Tax=Oceanipulchritudo coccoides TaxID=2706888 RepID=A0A6B2M344_9BACT|nr:MBL fold metallo-hydrolase [Oceanipulchritudo coccoides]NDV62732.1 MBL fold metallo-hydrolase [Oceanipulchritudo coccoides]